MSSAKLDRRKIVDASLDLLAREGLVGVSLRNVAAALGVRAPSLYWHVKDKQTLFGLMSEVIFRDCLARIPDVADWREWLRSFGLVLWQCQRDIRDVRPLIMQSLMAPEVMRELTAYPIDQLVARGISRSVAFHAQRSVQALVTGWTMLDYDPKVLEATPEESFVKSLDALIEGWEGFSSRGGRKA